MRCAQITREFIQRVMADKDTTRRVEDTVIGVKFLDRCASARSKPLTAEWGAPVRLRIPTKLGFESAKSIAAASVTNTYPGGYWEDQGYNWFSGS
jgi:hypothetical protein